MTLLREPLLHFVLLGAGLFALHRMVAAPEAEPGRIAITPGHVEQMLLGFSRTWQRPPTRQELEGLIEDRVREEVLAREAVALGLDRDDTVIRRRLRQKMEFVSQDLAEETAPGDADLQTFLDAHADRFRRPERFELEQVYVSTERRGERAAADAERILARLAADPEAPRDALGDASLLPSALRGAAPAEIARHFGEAFVAELERAPVGHWLGPLRSPYGLHLVRVAARQPGALPPLAEIRGEVEREWQATRRSELDETFYLELRRRYDVRVELPPALEGTPVAETGR